MVCQMQSADNLNEMSNSIFCKKKKKKKKYFKMSSALGKYSRQQFDILLFSKNTGFDISYKLSPKETLCMKYQILFPWKYKKKYFNMPSAENFTQNAKH